MKSCKNDEEFNINEDSYNISIKLIENKIKELENESYFNDVSHLDNLNTDDNDNQNDENKLEQKAKDCIDYIANINDDLKICINILKDLENSKKKS